MKKGFFALVFVILLVLAASSHAKADDKWKDKLDKDLREKVEKQSSYISALSSQEDVDVIVMTGDKNLEKFGNVKKKFSIIQAVLMSVPLGRLEQIARLDSVEKISSNYKVSAFRLEAIPLIRADSASSDFLVNGTNINISIIDTGIFNHSEFQSPNRIVQQKCFCTGCCQPNNVNSNNNATDDNGHGTHVAGIAAGKGANNARGVAINSSLSVVKVLNNNGDGYIVDIVSGIEWAVNNKAKIISMSLGAFNETCSDAMISAVDNATEQGVLAIVAAGNCGLGGSSTCPRKGNFTIASPACAKNALAVGSVSDTTDVVSDFSSRGPTNDSRIKPDLVAPGYIINSTVPPNSYCTGSPNLCSDTYYNQAQGTSMATPFVSGTAALVMEQYNRTFGYFPEPERVKAILLASANTSGMEVNGFVSQGRPYRNNYYGSGRLDAYRSLKLVKLTFNDTISQGQQKSFSFNIGDGNASVALVWGENSTTYNNLDLIVGNGTNNFTAGADRNDTVEHVFLRNVNNGTWNIYVNGTGVSGSQKFYIAYTQDNYPQWSANTSSPVSPANYSKNGNYSFNITWTDDVAVDEVVFEWNGTANYSYKMGNFTNYGSVFAANLTDLAVGDYSYKWYANDTSGKWNTTPSWNYSVARTSPNITILLNVSSSNFTIASGDFVNITAASAGEGNVSLYRSSSLVNNSLPPIYNITNYTGTAGTIFNITAFYNQTQNFTTQTATGFIKIDNTPPIFFNNRTYPSSPAPYGSHQFNITLFDETNISSVTLEWNFTTNYTVPTFSGNGSYNTAKEFYHSLSNLSVGNHTYRWLANDSMNNWNSSQNFSYSIIRADSLSRLFLNGTEGNAVYTLGQIANITASVNISGKNITVFANFSGASQMIANGTASAENYTNTYNLNVSTVYNITSFFAGDENYTSNFTTYYLGLCPSICPASSDWSSCSGGSQSRTVYTCSASTNYQCSPSAQAQSCSSGTSSPSGGGGPTTTAAAEKITVNASDSAIIATISNFAAGKAIKIQVNNTVEEIEIESKNKVVSAEIKIDYPKTITQPLPEGKVYNFIRIEEQNLTDLNRTVIKFFVNKSWIAGNGINESTIALNRYANGWQKLSTSITGDDSEKVFFKSTLSGFSIFAITGSQTVQVGQNATATNKTSGKTEERLQTPQENLIILIVILIIAAATAVAIFFVKKSERGADDEKK